MWLQVSTKGEYGVRIMVDLARHYGERPRSLTDIAQAELLPLAYLEQLAKLLREADPPLLTSTRGAHGGYRLSRPPTEITMGEVLRVLEGPIAPMICAREGEKTKQGSKGRPSLGGVWGVPTFPFSPQSGEDKLESNIKR